MHRSSSMCYHVKKFNELLMVGQCFHCIHQCQVSAVNWLNLLIWRVGVSSSLVSVEVLVFMFFYRALALFLHWEHDFFTAGFALYCIVYIKKLFKRNIISLQSTLLDCCCYFALSNRYFRNRHIPLRDRGIGITAQKSLIRKSPNRPNIDDVGNEYLMWCSSCVLWFGVKLYGSQISHLTAKSTESER